MNGHCSIIGAILLKALIALLCFKLQGNSFLIQILFMCNETELVLKESRKMRKEGRKGERVNGEGED